MNDLISRQTAIDALWAERMKLSEEMERNLETCSFALRADNKARRNRVEEDIEMIKQLPPAQPAELDTLIKALEQEHKKLLELQDVPPEKCEKCMMEHTDEMEKLEVELAMAQPKRGRWISADAIFGGVPFYCSECGENTRDTVMGKPRWKYCPMCGAKMRGEKDD